MSKIGISRQNIDDRLSQLLLENGRAMSKEEIRQSIPGINDFVIAFAILRQPHLLQWDYNEYNHINNIVITDDERETLSNAIKSDRFAQRLFERYPVICFSKRIMQGLSFEKQYRQFSKFVLCGVESLWR